MIKEKYRAKVRKEADDEKKQKAELERAKIEALKARGSEHSANSARGGGGKNPMDEGEQEAFNLDPKKQKKRKVVR